MGTEHVFVSVVYICEVHCYVSLWVYLCTSKAAESVCTPH